MAIPYFAGESYPAIGVQLKKASGAVLEDITGYAFTGKFISVLGGSEIVLAGTFSITDAALAKYQFQPDEADTTQTTGDYYLEVTHTRPAGGGVFTRVHPEVVTIK